MEIQTYTINHFISEAQIKRLFAIAKGKDRQLPAWTDAQIKDYLQDTFKITSTKEITANIYDGICETLAGAPFYIDVPGQVKIEVQ